jgi:Tfp pilus assembly protein PilO
MSNIIPFILILASVGTFIMYINPTYSGLTGAQTFVEKSVKELRADREQYATALTKTREISEIQTGLLTKFNSISRENREKLTKLLPDHVDTVRLIIDIERVVKRHGMKLENIDIVSVGKEQENTFSGIPSDVAGPTQGTQPQSQFMYGPQTVPYDAVNLTFTVAGEYDQFLSFLQDLENSLRIIDIYQLDFPAPDEGRIYSFAFKIKTYFLKK